MSSSRGGGRLLHGSGKTGSERSRLLADLARLDQRVHEMQLSAADGHVSSEKADLVLAHCAEDKRQLTDRLTLLDACLAELRGL